MHIEKDENGAYCGEQITPGEVFLKPGQVEQTLAGLSPPAICNGCLGELGKTRAAKRTLIHPSMP